METEEEGKATLFTPQDPVAEENSTILNSTSATVPTLDFFSALFLLSPPLCTFLIRDHYVCRRL